MIPPSGDGGRHHPWRSRRFAAIVGLVVVVVAVGAVLIVRQLTGGSVWTGVVISVQGCPADVHGCRAYVIPASDQQTVEPPVTAYADWSGAATTLDVRLGAGSYAVKLEGCSGDETDYTSVVVSSGRHPTVNLNTGLWFIPAFLSRTCPGFHPVDGYTGP
jgi:hypothetical protein